MAAEKRQFVHSSERGAVWPVGAQWLVLRAPTVQEAWARVALFAEIHPPIWFLIFSMVAFDPENFLKFISKPHNLHSVSFQ